MAGGGGFASGFGGGMSRLTRTLLLVYGTAFVLELVSIGWGGASGGELMGLLGLSPFLAPGGTLAKPWSLATHHLLQPPDALSAASASASANWSSDVSC